MTKRESYEQKTEALLMPVTEELGFETVDVEYVKEGQDWYLRVYADKEGGIEIDDCVAISRALEAGAKGAILKNSDLKGLRAAIHDVAEGKRHCSAEVEQIMTDDPPIPELSLRQLEILNSIVRGLSNPDIARQLGISLPMVKEHLTSLFAKLGVANRTEAVALALRKQLLKI